MSSAFRPLDFGNCRFPGCKHAAKLGGFCTTHKTTMKRRGVSDGVVTGAKRKLTDEQLEEARRMRSRFMTIKEIAAHFRVHEDTMRRYLRSLRKKS